MTYEISADRIKKVLLFAMLIMGALLHGYSVADVYTTALKKFCVSISLFLR